MNYNQHIKQVCYCTDPLCDESTSISCIVPAQLQGTQMSNWDWGNDFLPHFSSKKDMKVLLILQELHLNTIPVPLLGCDT